MPSLAPRQVAPIYAVVYVASTFFPAAASVVKDKIFGAAKERLGDGQQLDLFVVNSFGSLAQVQPRLTPARRFGIRNIVLLLLADD